MKRSEREEILRDPAAKGYVNTGRTKRVMRALKGKVVEYNYTIFKDTSTGKEIRIRTSESAIRRSRGEIINIIYDETRDINGETKYDKFIKDISKSYNFDKETYDDFKSMMIELKDKKVSKGEKLYMSSVNAAVNSYMMNFDLISDDATWNKSRKRIASAIFNTGELPEDLAARLSAQSGVRITEDNLLNPDNWHGDTFTFNGIRWRFHFTYSGDVLTREGV